MSNVEVERDYQTVHEWLASRGILLRRHGDVYTLSRDAKNLKLAAPLLMELFEEVTTTAVRHDLVRVASSGPVAPERFLEKLYALRPAIEARDEHLTSLAWTLAEAVRKRADESVYNAIVDVFRDRRYGRARQMLPYALARITSRRAESISVLVEALGDEDVRIQVMDALGKMKAVESASAVRVHLNSREPAVRQQAARTLKKLENQYDSKPVSTATSVAIPSKRAGEASVNLDLDQLSTVLDRLGDLVERFGPVEKRQVEYGASELEVDEECEFRFRVTYHGIEVDLHLGVFMCDEGALDLAVFTQQELAEEIRNAFQKIR